MKKTILITCFCLGMLTAHTQMYVDSLYGVQTFSDVVYGTTTDFAGNTRDLTMDISVPVGDSASPCRPLMVLVHGGAFLAGTKTDANIAAMREDFAERGYVTAAINYRLGMFQTSSAIHCNISYFGLPWDCLNQADTMEWSRALYRAIQDCKGAIRFMVNDTSILHIDPHSVFVVGESAGGFIALGTGYLDDASEYPTGVGAIASASAPNAGFYEAACVQYYGFDTSIASMNLTRPSLGDIEGTLNPGITPYTIKGVGSFYGAALTDYFQQYASSVIPALYMYHQPNDLIVPYDHDMILAGYAYCTSFFCNWYIANRPYCYGSESIRDLIQARLDASLPAPEYRFDSTLNFADCNTQLLNPSVSGHQIDNYNLRTDNMAVFFEPHVCTLTVDLAVTSPSVSIYPQPATHQLTIEVKEAFITSVQLYSLTGTELFSETIPSGMSQFTMAIPDYLPEGIYLLRATLKDGRVLNTKCLIQQTR
jgi:Carboxylesterase family